MFDVPSEVFHGVIGAASGGPALLEQSDCVLLAADNDCRVGYLKSTGTVFRLTQGWAELASLLKSTGRQPFTAWNAEARRLRDEHTQLIASRAEAQRVPGRTHSIDVVQVLKATLPSDASLVIDGGSIGQWAHQTLCTDRYPSYWLTCGRSGVVGYGLGGAMAAKLAMPQRPVVLLSGDGAFTFTVAEIECAVRQQIPFTAVVVDDQCWGITHSGHIKQFGKGVGTTLGAIDFARLAESMGARGQRIDSIDALAPALQQAMQSGEVTILHVPVSGGNPA